LKAEFFHDALHAAFADRPAALVQRLRDDLGRGLGIEEAVPDDLAHHFAGPAVVGSWSGSFALERDGAFFAVLVQELEIPLLGVSQFQTS